MGLASYGQPALRRRGAQGRSGAPPTARFALDLRYFEYHTTAKRSYSHAVRRRCSARRARRCEPLDPDDATRGAATPTSPPACSACSRTSLVDMRARCTTRPGSPTSASAAASRSTACAQRAHPARVAASSALFVPPRPGRRRLRARRGALRRSHPLRQARPRRPRSPVLGPERRRRRARARRRARTGSPLETRRRRRGAPRARRARARRRQDRRLDGRRSRARPARARQPQHPRRRRTRAEHARPAQPGASSTARSSARSRPRCRSRHAEHVLRPAAGRRAARRASCRASSRCGRSTARKLAAVTHVDGTARVQTVDREIAPRFHALLEAYGALSGHPRAAQHVVQPRRRADRQPRRRGLLDVPPLRHRSARRRATTSCRKDAAAERDARRRPKTSTEEAAE